MLSITVKKLKLFNAPAKKAQSQSQLLWQEEEQTLNSEKALLKSADLVSWQLKGMNLGELIVNSEEDARVKAIPENQFST
jgi:hypothetical protein